MPAASTLPPAADLDVVALARPTGDQEVPPDVDSGGSVVAAAEVTIAPARPDATPPAAPTPTDQAASSVPPRTSELVPSCALVPWRPALARDVSLVEKFRLEYLGAAVNPISDSASAGPGSLDQIPSATHGCLGPVCKQIKSFTEGALTELLASERSVMVSFPFPWERASTPTGCSPRDPGVLLSVGSDLPGTDLLTCLFFQAVCQRRQDIFDRLLAAYAAIQKALANLKRRSEAQAAEIAQLKSDLR